MSERLTVQYQGHSNVGNEINYKCKRRIERIEKQIQNIKQRKSYFYSSTTEKKNKIITSTFFLVPHALSTRGNLICHIQCVRCRPNTSLLLLFNHVWRAWWETEEKRCQERETRGAPRQLASSYKPGLRRQRLNRDLEGYSLSPL